jgi:NADH dehydrogenase/NADH:ubiquinone oxidoreductase subunit G
MTNLAVQLDPEELITKEQFEKVLPKHVKARLTDDMVVELNQLLEDPVLRENFRDNLFGYTKLLQEGKYKLQSYIDAVKFVSYKLIGNSNLESYIKTFPNRYQRLVTEGASNETISSYATMYNKTKLVNQIYEQTLVPSHVLNADIYQKAINTQAHLMMHAKSEKVRTDAANSLLNHLKKPESNKIELDIGFKEDKSIQELREATMALAEQQRQMIQAGASVKAVAESKIIEAEVVEE